MSHLTETTYIDGSIGGGQVLRNSSSLSWLLGKPITIDRIRENRPNPGLQNQHLNGIVLLSKFCKDGSEEKVPNESPKQQKKSKKSAKQKKKVGKQEVNKQVNKDGSTDSTSKNKSDGIFLGSTKLTFAVPENQRRIDKFYNVPIRTAGSIGLVVQSALPCLLLGSGDTVKLNIHGGTNVAFSPSVDYLELVFRHYFKKVCSEDVMNLKIVERGYFPKGNGLVKLSVNGIPKLNGFKFLNRGDCKEITIQVLSTGKSEEQARLFGEELFSACKDRLEKVFKVNFVKKVNVLSCSMKQMPKGNHYGEVLLILDTTTGCRFGITSYVDRKRKSPDQVAEDASNELISTWKGNGCVDEYMQDQLIIFMALAHGSSALKIGPVSDHTYTAIKVAEKLTKTKFSIEDDILTCEGIGYVNPNL